MERLLLSQFYNNLANCSNWDLILFLIYILKAKAEIIIGKRNIRANKMIQQNCPIKAKNT